MPELADNKAALLNDISVLRRRVAELQEIEQRYQEAVSALKAFEDRNRLLGDSTPLGIFTIDGSGQVIGLNRKMLELWSRFSIENPESLNLFESSALFGEGIINDLKRCIKQQKPVIVAYPHVDARGTTYFFRYYLSAIPGSGDHGDDVMAIVEDNSDLKQAEEALRDSEKRYRQLFQSAPIALIEWDVSPLKAYLDDLRASGISDFNSFLTADPQQIQYCWSLIRTENYNQAFLKLMGIVDANAHTGAFLPTDSAGFMKMAREVILMAASGKTSDEREEELVTATGETKIVFGRSLSVSGHEDTLERVVIALVDISQRKAAESALRASERRFREQAMRDGLTGLHNQRYLYQSLGEWIERAGPTNMPISLIFMDLDHFKVVVDTYGHLNGSRAIHLVAGSIESCLQTPAYAVAYAGDEFVVVLPGMDADQALEKAAEIRSKVKQSTYVLDQGIEVRLQASFGIATFPQDATDLNGLIAAADDTLFDVKRKGKDGIGQFQRG